MGKRFLKSILSCALAFVMVLTLIPLNSDIASASTKATLSNKKITLTEGMIQNLKVKNVTNSTKVKWQSLNKKVAKVDSIGNVKGIKDGNTSIKCTVTQNGKKTVLKSNVTFKTPKFKQTSYQISKGETVSLALQNKYRGSKYQWKSSDKSVAMVNSKGNVKGITCGSATISVKISIPKKGTRKAITINKKVKVVVVAAEAVVSTQSELESALKNSNVTNIILKTDSKEKFVIPEENYENVFLKVDAPNADVENHGNFKLITIKQIAADTWTELAKDNVLILDAAAGHVIIPTDSGIKEIRIVHASSNFKLDVQGNLDKISVESETKVDIKLSGKVQNVDINSRSTVSIEGTSTNEITFNVGEDANGTIINSDVKTSITSAADTEINLSKGAEGSSVKTTKQDKSVEITNNTSDAISVTNKDGKNQSVSAGKNATVNGNGEVTQTTTSDSSGGASSGGGASSSGDLTRVVTNFETVPLINAGIYGTPLKSVKELMNSFPTEMTGFSSSGDVVFPVLSWENTDNYSKEASAGYYTFTAVLGEGNRPCMIQSGVKAYVKVWIKPANGGITYTKKYSDSTNHFELVEDTEIGDKLVLKLKYTGEPYARAHVTVNYYNQSGDLIKSSYEFSSYFQKNDTESLLFGLPKNSSGEVVSYSAYTINIGTYEVTEYQSVKDKLIIGTPSKIIYNEDEDDWYYFTLPIENKGSAEISNGELIIYYWKGDKIIGVNTESLAGVVGGETTNRKIYADRYLVDGTYVIPDGVTVDYNYANVPSKELKQNGEDKSIIYTNEYSDSTNHFELVEDTEIGDKLVLKLKYTGEPYARAHVTVNYYNQSGDLIKSSYEFSSYFQKNDTESLLFGLPKNSSGEVVSYSAYTINIGTYEVTEYQSVKDKLIIGTPSKIIYNEDEDDWYYFTLPIENKGSAEISNGELIIYYWKGDKIIGVNTESLAGVVGGETTNRKIYADRYLVDGTYVIPDGVTVDYNYANVLMRD